MAKKKPVESIGLQDTLPGGITQAQLNQWKSRWGDVYLVEVPLDDEGEQKAAAYFKKPGIDAISASARFMESDPVKGANIILESCWLGGDQVIKDSDEARLSCMQSLGKLVTIRASTIKKL
ncbi:MAG TPA: hypothetical protein VLH56_16965 [Dissulfurispiraceae bacterium]|nr:hypothetical protein [Dissulfurispiraceae bacterium]